jgi:hypothetical protein
MRWRFGSIDIRSHLKSGHSRSHRSQFGANDRKGRQLADQFGGASVRCTPILLKKSLTVLLTEFSGVFLPLTGVRERFVGRSERSIFSRADRKDPCSDFFNSIPRKLSLRRQDCERPSWGRQEAFAPHGGAIREAFYFCAPHDAVITLGFPTESSDNFHARLVVGPFASIEDANAAAEKAKRYVAAPKQVQQAPAKTQSDDPRYRANYVAGLEKKYWKVIGFDSA